MKKLHSFAFYALATPIITLGAGPVLAQQSTGQDMNRSQQSTTPTVTPSDQNKSRDYSSSSDQKSMQGSQSTGSSAQSNPRDQSASPSTPKTSQGAGSAGAAGAAGRSGAAGSVGAAQSESQSAADRMNASSHAKQNKGFISSAPARGMHTNNLIGAKVKTTGDVDVGPVEDLIIDENGQVVAIVVSVGGFLGMGEREVAIGWDDVTKSGDSDDLELKITSTRDQLRSAPEFKKLED